MLKIGKVSLVLIILLVLVLSGCKNLAGKVTDVALQNTIDGSNIMSSGEDDKIIIQNGELLTPNININGKNNQGDQYIWKYFYALVKDKEKDERTHDGTRPKNDMVVKCEKK